MAEGNVRAALPNGELSYVPPSIGVSLSGTWLWLARAAWIALVGLALFLFAAGAPLQFMELTRGTFGIELKKNAAGETVASPMPGLPAEAAGLRAGDVLLTVNGVPVPPQLTVPKLLQLTHDYDEITVDVRSAGTGVHRLVIARASLHLASQSLSPGAYAAYLLVLDGILILGSVAIALLIFVRRSHDGLALLISLELVLLAARVTDEITYVGLFDPKWQWAALLLTYVGVAVLPLAFALFPDGKFVPRWTVWYALFGLLYGVFVITVPSGTTIELTLSSLRLLFDWVFVGVGVVAQIYRYFRHSTLRGKQQTKWVLFGIILAFTTFYGSGLPKLIAPGLVNSVLSSTLYQMVQSPIVVFGLLMVPVTLAVAILRSHLWDIDILIRRTLTYSLVTTFLLLTYFLSVVVLQQIFSALTGGAQNEIVTVLSTLGIAILFVPLRTGIQNAIDKRFNRKKYNAQQVLNEFANMVRDETDLEKLTAGLMEVVNETMQPANMSVWLKKEGRELRGDRRKF